MSTAASGVRRHAELRLGLGVVAGIGVAIGLGVYGRVHDPSGYGLNLAGFSSGLAAKSWLTSAALVLAVGQVVTGAGMWGRLGLGDRGWVAPLHRWSGRLALLAVVPVAAHCLYALGYQSPTPRVLIHSLLGCVFFGAFTTKMLALRTRHLPARALPLLGGLLFAVLSALWLTSALWFFTSFGVHR